MSSSWQIQKSYKSTGSVFTVNLFTQKMTFLIGPEPASAFFQATDKELGQDEVYGSVTHYPSTTHPWTHTRGAETDRPCCGVVPTGS